MRWATKSPCVPSLMPRSRYSKISRKPGVHLASLARLCTKSQVLPVMISSFGFRAAIIRPGRPWTNAPTHCWRSAPRLQRLDDGLGVAGDHGQIGARGLVGLGLALLPIAQRSERNAEA